MVARHSLADNSNGYEKCAEAFIRSRSPLIGVATVRKWGRALPPGSAILDLGCGHGIPIGRALIEEGFSVFGVDASPRLIAEFQRNCPDAHTECAGVEDSAFFGRRFQGIVACGIVFLLKPEKQIALIGKIAEALEPGGSLIFTAPEQACTWNDVLTGHLSTSLGAQKYGEVLGRHGLTVVGEDSDEGDNHHYFVKKQR